MHADAAEDLQAVGVGEHDVEQHEVDSPAAKLLVDLRPVRGPAHVVAGVHEDVDEELGEVRVVLDDEDGVAAAVAGLAPLARAPVQAQEVAHLLEQRGAGGGRAPGALVRLRGDGREGHRLGEIDLAVGGHGVKPSLAINGSQRASLRSGASVGSTYAWCKPGSCCS